MSLDNNYIWFLMLFVNYSFITLAFRFFKKEGLFAWVVLSSVLANIQVLKTVELFGFVTTLGNIIYGTSFLATDILGECYSKKEAKKAVWMGVFALVATTVVMQISLWFYPHSSDVIQGPLSAIFGIMPRIMISSITAYICSQHFDVWFYHRLKEKFPAKLWIRNNFSTMISQLLDNIIFTLMAFWGVFELEVLWQIFISTYLLKWVVAFLDTPVIYWAKNYHQRKVLNAKAPV